MNSKILFLCISSLSVSSVALAQQNTTRTESYTGQDENGTWRVRKSIDGNGNTLSYDSSYTQSKNRDEGLLADDWDNTEQQRLSQQFKMDLGNLFGDPSQNGTDLLELFKNEDFDFSFPDMEEMMAELNQLQEKMLEQYKEAESNEKDPKEHIKRNATDM